jgi:hypothetical protein
MASMVACKRLKRLLSMGKRTTSPDLLHVGCHVEETADAERQIGNQLRIREIRMPGSVKSHSAIQKILLKMQYMVYSLRGKGLNY